MENQNLQFSRKELHELIWKEPISKISERLNIKDSLLRRKCKENNIPTPDSGYWSKLKFGKEVNIEPLHKDANLNSIITFEKRAITARKVKETNRRIKTKVPERLSKPSSLIKQTLNEFIKNSKGYSSDGMFGTGKGCLSIYVTPFLIKRALRIFDTIIKSLQQKGYEISTEKGTVAIIDGIKVPVRMREKNNRTPKKEQKFSWTEYDYSPSGQLVFVIELYSFRREEYYENTVKLEQKVDRIVEEIIKQGIEEKEYQIRCEIHRKEEKVRKEQEAAMITAINEELEKFKAIFSDQERWHKAQIMRQYLDNYEKHYSERGQLDEEKIDWLA